MRICSRFLTLVLSVTALAAPAQVLARPGWAGSGVAAEPWWRRAIFYRIDPTRFQDSDNDGAGDVAGIAQRLDYIQRLGVDAVILTPPVTPDDFATLARRAADAHLRILITLPTPDPAQARLWLNQGAAGLFVDTHNQPSAPAQLRELRRLADTFPGERVILTSGSLPAPDGAELAITANVSSAAPGLLRQSLQHGLDAAPNPLLTVDGLASGPARPGGQQAITERTLAAMVLASRAAVIFDAGRELGLRSSTGKPVAMQWTPSNLTRDTPSEATKKPSAPKEEVYGTYTPYVPAPKLAMPPPKLPNVVESSQPDPNTLPGFSATAAVIDEALNPSANAAEEDVDPNSLLNFYRHLIALHHDNGSLRNGSQTLFDRDAQNSLVWVRRAPAGSRIAASVVVAANLSEQPAEISLGRDFDQLHIRSGTLRPLLTASAGEALTSASTVIPVESADHLVLPAYTVFLGELYHEGASVPDDSTPGKHSGRRHRRR